MAAGWDEAVFRAINSGWQSPTLDPVFWFFSLGIKTWTVRVGLGALLAFLVWRQPTRSTALLAVVAAILANEAADLAKFAYQGYRPPAILDGVRVLGSPLTSAGTISAHSATMAAVAAVFWLTLGRRWGGAWALVALLTGVSRAYVGAHFPSQILLGWGIGAGCGWVCVAVWRLLLRRRSQPRLEPGEPSDRA
jgi:membrane-associated phospholipid phosphatase